MIMGHACNSITTNDYIAHVHSPDIDHDVVKISYCVCCSLG